MRSAGGALRPWTIALLAGVVAVVITVAAFVVLFQPPATKAAPDFTLTDIDGNTVHLADFRGKITVLDFMYINCASCELARPVVQEVFAAHAAVMEGVSIDIVLLDSQAQLQTYRDQKGIPWHVARDTAGVAGAYVVREVVRLFLVGQDGSIIFDRQGMSPGDETALRSDLENTIGLALQGRAPAISIQQVSIFALAALAGVASFFSPCSFPMLPGYMAFFLSLDAKKQGAMTKRRAVLSGTLSSMGIILVYGIIAAVLILTAGVAAAYVPPLQGIVGFLLIVMGAVMFTAVQYNWLVNPFRSIRQKVFPRWTPNEVRTVQGKLFSYGVGYGAAGFGCVAPPFIAAILGATVIGGLPAGLAVLAVYAGVVILLMAVITVALATLGQAAVKKMNRYTELIKKVSAAVLIVAGAYLIYYWYSAWVA